MNDESSEVKVLVAIHPPLYSEQIQRQLEANPMVEVVGRTSRPSETLVMARELLADVVLIRGEESDAMPGLCTHLFSEFPNIVTIAIAPNVDHAIVYRRKTCAEKVSGVSRHGLAHVLSDIYLINHEC